MSGPEQNDVSTRPARSRAFASTSAVASTPEMMPCVACYRSSESCIVTSAWWRRSGV